MAQSSTDLTAACRRLVEIANERGGEDNITVIIARFDGEALQTGTDSSSITGSFKVNKSRLLRRPGPGGRKPERSPREHNDAARVSRPALDS